MNRIFVLLFESAKMHAFERLLVRKCKSNKNILQYLTEIQHA